MTAPAQANGVVAGDAGLQSDDRDGAYSFADQKIRKTMEDESRTPLCLVACGSFSPITFLHLRMFEMVADYTRRGTEFEVVAGYLSPVSDAYKKDGLIAAKHRIPMCEIASQSAAWLMVDPWEARRPEYTRTALVLDHFEHEINGIRGGIAMKNGERKQVRIALLAGSDLLATMSTPGVWSKEDLGIILGQYGAFIVERSGTSIEDAMTALQPWKNNIWVISQLIQNDVSSTKIRFLLNNHMSINYLTHTNVIDYIKQHDLYQSPPHSPKKSETATNQILSG